MTYTEEVKRIVRTAIQAAAGLAAAAPVLAGSKNITGTVPGLATALAVSVAVTKLMQLLDPYLPDWLRIGEPK